jgi:hypothetical protein
MWLPERLEIARRPARHKPITHLHFHGVPYHHLSQKQHPLIDMLRLAVCRRVNRRLSRGGRGSG